MDGVAAHEHAESRIVQRGAGIEQVLEREGDIGREPAVRQSSKSRIPTRLSCQTTLSSSKSKWINP
jgi:hypothetical protein